MTLLDDLLRNLIDDEIHTLDELSHEMDISPGLLEQMLQDLERGGYLRAVESSCEGRCTDCPQRAACALSFGGRLWTVTEKGYRTAGAPGHGNPAESSRSDARP
ncbi:MAG: hypothetical protein FJZ90_18085 [Chloroflexi bacterium]|nr:hypothetical protein [Chloroflexota bacterium]